MRTLHADLLAAQRSTNAPMYLQVVLTKPGGSDVKTYTTADSHNRIVGVEQEEKQYSGKAEILLDNSDGHFNLLNFTGYVVQIGWGFNCSGTNRYSNTQYMWVVSQTEVSRYGKLLTQLVCYDIWNMIAETRVFSGAVKLTGTVTKTAGYNPVGRKLTGSSSGAYGTITHYQSTELLVSNVVGSFSGETATIGTDLQISISAVQVLDTMAGGAKQYSADTHIQDIVALLLSNWVNSPTVDSDDPLNNYTTFMPLYNVWVDAKLSTVIQEMLDFTLCGMRMRDGVMHVLYLSEAPATDYTYDGVHNIAGCDRTRQLSFPNRIYVVDNDPYQYAPNWVGSAVDTASYALLGKYIDAVVVVPTVTSNSQATAVALSLINRGKQAVNSGGVILPMINVGQEVLDWIVLTDARNSNMVVTGRVGTITRKLENGKLSMSIELGGLKIPANFRTYPSPYPPQSVGGADLVQELILGSTIWAGYGKVKLSSAGICIIGDADSENDAMLRFASSSPLCNSVFAYISYHGGDSFSIITDDELRLTGGGGILAAIADGDFYISGVGALILPSTSSDPAGRPDGAIYYNSSTKKIRQKLNGSWSDLGGSPQISAAVNVWDTARVAGTVYQNTAGNMRVVVVSIKRTGASHNVIARIGVTNPPILLVAQALVSIEYAPVTFLVPNNYYYKIDTLSAPYDAYKWTEYDLVYV